MRILVVSDSHGNQQLLSEVVGREACDEVIHCGDFCTDENALPAVNLTAVRGNCDWELVPEERTVVIDEEMRILVTHGHRYHVERSLLMLRYRAQEMGVHIVCFGHTHRPLCMLNSDLLLLNPGSLTQPRGVRYPSYAIVTTRAKRTVEVAFYEPNGEEIVEHGGRFQL
ncbi:metallophosphoesterase [Mechercharimyces sp. CAU 1602]|uniref:metallophosphoesterase family protein n=1 Tax=Mechercharimyces sp. CAU 1602 TaxID=2973933 RepID=UPI0021626EE7|nr:metallophosphoesterase [Mechercharimyces sp. CAU 1602]MCS1351477.1 metallophosphoesterase [Mechercharimyces sp. CAU 1602]